MKLNFSKSVGRPWAKSLPLLAGLLLSPLAVMATVSTATFTGTITTPPQVDATNFVNSSGTWDIHTSPGPYHTANTLNYTNESSMTGSVGWDFALYPSTTGQRGMSASFFNDNNGIIQAVDGTIYNPPNNPYSSSVSYLLISATNIVNKGTLIGGAAGEILLTGSTVNLSRSHLGINPISGGGSVNGSSNFTSETAIYDEYWGQTNTFPNSTAPYTLNSSSIWDGATASSPTFYVSEPCEMKNVHANIEPFVAIFADSTNIIAASGTNIFRQAVFVNVTDTNITASDGFLSTGNISNLFQTVTVELTNSADGETLYLVDILGSSTNRGLLNNKNYIPGSNPQTSCTDPTYRPANYTLERVDNQFTNYFPGAGPPTNNFLYDPSFTNAIVPATYAAYSAYIDDLARRPSGAAVTNLPGRIIINADNLNLTRTTITNYGGAEIVIQANNLTGAPTLVSCQNLSYNLGCSTNGYLNVTNLVGSSGVPGLNGTLSAFSALWTNTAGGFTYYFHILIVDATGLSPTAPVYVQDLILNSTNMVVSDPFIDVMQTLLFGQSSNVPYSLTLQRTLKLDPSGNLQNWTYANAPYLRYFTNNGILTIPQDAHFGDDGPMNYAAFVNNGRIAVGGGLYINSDYYWDGGIDNAPGGFFLTTSNGVVAANITTFWGDVDFTGGALELTNATITVINHLNFNMTNALYDAGPSSGNTITCFNGFSLLSMPTSSATNNTLMGTTITSWGLNGAEVDHVWAATDFGPTNVFTNNVVIGNLVLTDDGSEPLFVFSGIGIPGVTNGLYVSNLDLTGLSGPAYEDEIQIAPNLNIYYISVTPPGAVTDLSSQFNGHFINVPGATAYVVKQPSGPSPKLSAGVVGSGQQFQLTVNGTAGQIYILQASTDLTKWVGIYTGTPPFIVTDLNVSNYPARFYQVVPGP